MNIVCVRRGDKYPSEYVTMLRGMVGEIHCLDDEVLQSDWPGWWAKMELFAPWNRHLRPCLYLDLDTYVLEEIDDLLEYEFEDFWMLRNFNIPERGGSGVMLIPEDVEHIWRKWIVDPETHMKRHEKRGDQGFLEQFPFKRLQDRFDGIGSYKRNKLQDDPKGFRVVCFHGKPKPHETNGWAGEIWTRYRRLPS